MAERPPAALRTWGSLAGSMRRHVAGASALGLTLMSVTPSIFAEDEPVETVLEDQKKDLGPGWGGSKPPPYPAMAEQGDLAPGDKRELLDYDGRPDETSTEEDALWIPRVLFFPIYLVTEYLIVAPLTLLGHAAEGNDAFGLLVRSILFEPSEIGVIPTAFVEFGFRPSAGLVFFWDNFLAKGNDFRASFGFGGIRYWKFGAADRIPLVPPVGAERSLSYIQLEADFLARGDLLFWGIGARTLDEDETGYGIRTWGGGARIHLEPWRGNFYEAWVTARDTTTGPGECADPVTVIDPDAGPGHGIARSCDPPTIRQRLLQGAHPPPGYARPYFTIKSGVRVVGDTRERRPAPGTGVAADLSVEQVTETDAPDRGAWFNYGGSFAGFWDITGTQRVLSLTLTARFIQPTNEGYTIPFTELIGSGRIEDVPDLELMKGFRPGRLVGRSAAAATLEYRWPVWAFLDGTVQAAVGNVFSEYHLEDFRPELCRFSFIAGIRSINHRDHSFNLLVGVGTETFDQGAAPNAARILIGGTTGF
jgi:hypothetical protein